VPDFDARVQFLHGPGDYYTLILDKRDISNHLCVFDGPNYGPSFVPDRAADGAPPVKLCYECEEHAAKIAVRPPVPLKLQPGEVARQTGKPGLAIRR